MYLIQNALKKQGSYHVSFGALFVFSLSGFKLITIFWYTGSGRNLIIYFSYIIC